MAIKSLGDPFDPDTHLEHSGDCVCASCRAKVAGLRLEDKQRTALLERQLEAGTLRAAAMITRRRRVSMMLQQKEALKADIPPHERLPQVMRRFD